MDDESSPDTSPESPDDGGALLAFLNSDWTDEVIEGLAASSRLEIEEGKIILIPPAPGWHQDIRHRINMAIRRQCPAAWWPMLGSEIRVHDGQVITDLRSPDVMVVPRNRVQPNTIRCWVGPDEVPLVTEVTSPHTKTADRIAKVWQYASWGIPLYLRLETEPEFGLYAYRLDPETGKYLPPTVHRNTFATEEPFPFHLDLTLLA